MCKKLFLAAAILTASMQADAQAIAKNYKEVGELNPISPCVFCADPTAIDYKGRLYVYGTNDHQQFIINQKKGTNGYGNIKSLVVFSTDDMVNWTFHGTIDVGKVCGSWCGQSWAPSAVWRTNSQGKDEFFIYFANGGGSVGVIKGSSPIGPFTSPNSQAMITHGMSGVDPCNWVFDPGAVIDENGQGWIAFGGGDPQSSGSKLWPGNSRIAKLKPSMTEIDGSVVNMPAPYLFEASELNMIGGRYVYTYNTSWGERPDWGTYEKSNGQPAPSPCSMCYMVTDTPLKPSSWEYRGEYVPNEGNFGMGWGNNHTHLHKFQDKYYLFYHSTVLEEAMNTGASGFRSIGVDVAKVTDSTQTIDKVTLTKKGVTFIKRLNPYELQQAETMCISGGVNYEHFTNIKKNTDINTLGNDASENMQVKMVAGAWTMVTKVDFGTTGASSFMLRAKGKGKLELRLGNKDGKAAATLEFSSSTYQDHVIELNPATFKSLRNLYLVYTEANNAWVDAWQFTEAGASGINDAQASGTSTKKSATYDLGGRIVNNEKSHRHGVVIDRYADGKSVKRVVSR